MKTPHSERIPELPEGWPANGRAAHSDASISRDVSA